MPNFAKVAFKAPKFSSFQLSVPVNGTVDFGDVFPIYWEFLRPKERVKMNLSQLTRLQTLNAPVMSGFDLTIDAFVVPLRLILGREPAEQYLNLSGSSDFQQLGNQITLGLLSEYNTKGSLLDYLGYPVFDNVDKYIRKVASEYTTGSGSATYKVTSQSSLTYGKGTGTLSNFEWLGQTNVVVTDVSLANLETNFLGAAGLAALSNRGNASVAPEVKSYTGSLLLQSFSSFVDSTNDLVRMHFNATTELFGFGTFILYKAGFYGSYLAVQSGIVLPLSELLKLTGKSVELLFDEWIQYLRTYFFREYVPDAEQHAPFTVESRVSVFKQALMDAMGEHDDDSDFHKSTLPIAAYWRIISDWYYNYNSGPLNSYELFDLLNYSFSSPGKLQFPSDILNPYEHEDYPDLCNSWRCFKRNWKNDYFTSCLPSPTSTGSDMRIPVDGTIPELREANIWQKMYERAASAGRKYRDNIKAFFGITPDASTLDMAQVLCRDVRPLDIQTVDQTNQHELDKALASPLGSMAGQSTTFHNGISLFDYTADEDCVLMILGSYRPLSMYMQGCDRRLSYSHRLDWLWPELTAIGDQSVKSSEIFCDMDLDNPSRVLFASTFGWQRRYGELMYRQGSVHGDMRDSLNFWNTARQFDSAPTLDPYFTQIDSRADHINRIFAYEDNPRPILYFFHLYGSIARPIPRYINYDL